MDPNENITVAQLVDYLRQFDPGDIVVLTLDEVVYPGEFVALDAALQQMRAEGWEV